MSRQNSRNERIIQMSQQELLIAKKKQQILEKQKASLLAKKIIAESTKTKSVDKPDQTTEGVSMKNTFNNDGSFLSQFKKITEHAMQTKDVIQTEETVKREGQYSPQIENKIRLEPILQPPPLTFCGTNTTFFDPSVQPQLSYPLLHTISPPKPLELNSIPQPKELDLNAIPKPVMNLDKIKIPAETSMHFKILSEKLPTTVEQLVELVAEVGDVYEEKLCSRIKDLHPSLWFLFDKQSEGYKNYRHLVAIRKQHKDADKYDPAEILDKEEEDDDLEEQSQVKVCYYDDKSTTENDSDTEYLKETKERNLKNLKKKTMKASSVQGGGQSNDSSTESDSDDQHDSNHEAYENMSFNRNRSLKTKRKSRWDHSDENSAVNKVPLDAESPSSKNDPAFLQFVYSNYATLEISDEKWKKAENHYHVKQLYEIMANHIQDHDRFLVSNVVGKFDSEEERLIDSNKVKSIMMWINELTKLYDSHTNKSMSDFLMPLEMKTFKEKFVTKNRELDFEDYKKYKLEQSKFMSTNRNFATSPNSMEKVESPTLKRNLVNGDTPVDSKKPRKSRWGDQVQIKTMINPNIAILPSGSGKPLLSLVTRTDPALLAYARQNFGTTDLTEEDWRKAEEHFKINLLFQDMLKKRQEIDSLAKGGKFKYEYDSDEDVTGGTWEHKLRSQEMEATEKWADALNKQSEGKHHIGDFLPPEELKKFMEKYDAKKHNRQPNLSDYKEFKLKEDNVGFQMLQKLGWIDGQGLGAGGSGITEPVNKAAQRDKNQGLGIMDVGNPEEQDNEYDTYRKRMMLAYRFRPNPLNNPRRAYY